MNTTTPWMGVAIHPFPFKNTGLVSNESLGKPQGSFNEFSSEQVRRMNMYVDLSNCQLTSANQIQETITSNLATFI